MQLLLVEGQTEVSVMLGLAGRGGEEREKKEKEGGCS